MFKKIAIGLVALFGVFLLIIQLQPSEFRVARSIQIDAPPAVVFNIINDLRQGSRWSPWEKMDPDMKKTFSGPEAGVGATYAWDGDDSVGAGHLKITTSQPNELVVVELSVIRPYEGTSEVKYELKPVNGGTDVTWSMSSKNSFVAKAMCLFMNMEQMVGEQFEEGLANLKKVAEEDAWEPSAEEDSKENTESVVPAEPGLPAELLAPDAKQK